MANEKALDYDAQSGIIIERDLTEEESKELKKFQLESKEFVKALEARSTARESALAKLAALGLTEEEIASL